MNLLAIIGVVITKGIILEINLGGLAHHTRNFNSITTDFAEVARINLLQMVIVGCSNQKVLHLGLL